MPKRDKPRGPLMRLRHKLEAACIQMLFWTVPLCPRPLTMMLGDALGTLASIFLKHDRDVAMANVRQALGKDVPDKRAKQLAHHAFQTLARAIIGLIWNAGRSAETIKQLVEVDLAEQKRNLAFKAAGRGMIYVIPHYYDWESSAMLCPLVGVPMTLIAEPGVNPIVGHMIARARASTGNRVVTPKNVLVTLLKTLKRGQTVGLLIDVNARRGRGGVWVDFFGLPVYQSVAAAALALKTDAVIVCCLSRELPRRRVHLQMTQTFTADDAMGDDEDARIKDLSQKVLGYYESAIRNEPEHWLWTYKRWKRRPTAERGRFPFYSKFDPGIAVQQEAVLER